MRILSICLRFQAHAEHALDNLDSTEFCSIPNPEEIGLICARIAAPALGEVVAVRSSFSLWTLSYCALRTAAVLPARLRLAQFTEVERLSTGRPGTAVSPPPSGSSKAWDTE